jgi:hypothetical protein
MAALEFLQRGTPSVPEQMARTISLNAVGSIASASKASR